MKKESWHKNSSSKSLINDGLLNEEINSEGDLIINASPRSPFVRFQNNGFMQITGSSTMESACVFYEPVKVWLDKYTSKPNLQTFIVLNFKNINADTHVELIDILKKLVLSERELNSIKIKWLVESGDETMYELILDLSDSLGIEISIVEI